MISLRCVVACLAGALMSVGFAAQAAQDPAAYKLYEAGDYDAAVTAATGAATGEAPAGSLADNLVLAARALNAEAYFDERKAARRTAERAQEFAEAALEENPDHVEAHLQAAIAMSVRGSNMNMLKAFFLNLPERSREHIDRALELTPENPWALSTSGAWRMEVSRRGGGAVYGADPALGYQEMLKARELAPDNVVIAYEAALRMLASERPAWRETALAGLEDALNGEPETAFETQIQARARELAAALAAGPEALKEFIEAQP